MSKTSLTHFILGMIDFTEGLEAQFHWRTSKAFKKLTPETFTAKDAQDDHEVTGFL